MISPVRKALSAYLAVIGLTLSAVSFADPVERVVSLDVNNTRAHMAAMDQFFSSDFMRGRKATMWAPIFPGSSPANRVLVISYDSFAELVSNGQRVTGSREWMEFQNAVEGTSEVVANSMAQQVLLVGSLSDDHGAVLVVTMSVSDAATYIEAFGEMIESVDNPGAIRLMQLRYGGGATNMVALFAGPDAVAVNNYVDNLQGNEAFQEFADEVSDIRKVNNISIMRRVKTWGE